MHEPIKYHQNPTPAPVSSPAPEGTPEATPGAIGDSAPVTKVRPTHIDLQKDKQLTIRWSDGHESVYSIGLLRKLSPSADARELRKEMDRNPLTVLPSGHGGHGPLTALGVEMVGNYAIRINFSDGHNTGIYTWHYLRHIDPNDPDRVIDQDG